MLAEGVLGDVVHVTSVFGYELSGPYGAAILADAQHWVRKLPGQLFHNNIDHMLNKLSVFFGGEEPEVDARALCFRGNGGPTDLPDELRILLTGRRVTAFANFSANAKPTAHALSVWGTKASVSFDYVSRSVTFSASPQLPSAIGRLLVPFDQGYRFAREGVRNAVRFAKSEYHFNSGLGQLFERFYDSILHDTAPPISDAEMLWVASIMERTFEQTRRPVMEAP
jgi:predicted dehydrogenase